MTLTDIRQSWATHYESLTQAVQERGVEDAVQWILRRGPWTYNNLRRKLFASLGIGSGSSLLQAGCGIGKSGIAEALLVGCQVTLLDYSAWPLESAALVIKRLAVHYPQVVAKVRLLQGALENLPFENSFDVTFNEGVLEHWFEDRERLEILRQLVKATKVGGKIVIFVPNESNRFYRARIAKVSKLHSTVPPEKAFTSEELRQKMEKAGLADVQVKGFAPHLSFGGYIGLRPFAMAAWLVQHLFPRGLFNAYAEQYGFFLVGIGTKR
jgi:SAM-dependent methyltransferase